MTQTQALTSSTNSIQSLMSNEAVKKRIVERLGKNSAVFMTSVLDVCRDDQKLQQCDPNKVMQECLKSAGLDLPINRNLGFAYIIPYKEKGIMTPHFQMSYKGYIQLAIRTGQYKHLNADVVYEGETMVVDRIKGTLTIEGEATSEKATGFFAYMELINGFQKAIGWSAEKVLAHGKRYSKSFSYSTSLWKTDFEAMGMKTMILQLVPKYGPMTISMAEAISSDKSDFKGFENIPEDIQKQANQTIIDIEPEPPAEERKPDLGQPDDEMMDEEKAQIQKREIAEAQPVDGPAF